jgi:hypothetical protein
MNGDSRIASQTKGQAQANGNHRWDFLTNHAHVLLCVAQDAGIRLRDIAAAVGITERSAHKILSELVDEGYVLRERHGRRNRYKIKPELPLRHPLVQKREVGALLEMLMTPPTPNRKAHSAQDEPFSGAVAKGSAG